jgi:hypothetical protein
MPFAGRSDQPQFFANSSITRSMRAHGCARFSGIAGDSAAKQLRGAPLGQMEHN